MCGDGEPRNADLEEVAAKLSEGLKSCRSVVQNYRMMLSADQVSSSDSGDVSALLKVEHATELRAPAGSPEIWVGLPDSAA